MEGSSAASGFPPPSNRTSGAKSLCLARNRRRSVPVISAKMRSVLRNYALAAVRPRSALARTMAFQADCTDYSRPPGRHAHQSGIAAVSASVVRAATTFCIIVMNRFCSALLRPSSVS